MEPKTSDTARKFRKLSLIKRCDNDGKWRVFSWCRRTPPLHGQMFPSALICRRDRSSGLDLYPPNEPHHLLKSQCNADEHTFCLQQMSNTRALGKSEKKRKIFMKIARINQIWVGFLSKFSPWENHIVLDVQKIFYHIQYFIQKMNKFSNKIFNSLSRQLVKNIE